MERIKFPYSVSNFKTLVSEGNLYFDRTAYLEKMEQMDTRYHFFLRNQLKRYLSHPLFKNAGDFTAYLWVVVGYAVKVLEEVRP